MYKQTFRAKERIIFLFESLSRKHEIFEKKKKTCWGEKRDKKYILSRFPSGEIWRRLRIRSLFHLSRVFFIAGAVMGVRSLSLPGMRTGDDL